MFRMERRYAGTTGKVNGFYLTKRDKLVQPEKEMDQTEFVFGPLFFV